MRLLPSSWEPVSRKTHRPASKWGCLHRIPRTFHILKKRIFNTRLTLIDRDENQRRRGRRYTNYRAGLSYGRAEWWRFLTDLINGHLCDYLVRWVLENMRAQPSIENK